MNKPLTTSLTLLTALTACAGGFYVEPIGSLVYPNSSHIKYHGMAGKVEYANGQSIGFRAGYDWEKRGLYAGYDYTSFNAKQAVLQTPIGEVTMPNNEKYECHTVTAGARAYLPKVIGLQPFVSAGSGVAINDTISPCYDLVAGLSKEIDGYNIAIAYVYRFTDGMQRYGKKSDGSYSIENDNPNTQRLTLSVSKRF